MIDCDTVYDYVQNKHPALILDQNGQNGHTTLYLQVPYLTQEDIQQNQIFFFKSATNQIENPSGSTVIIKTLDGNTSEVTYTEAIAINKVYAFTFDVNNNILILPFHDTAIAEQVTEMYTGKYKHIMNAITIDDGDVGLTLSGYNQHLTINILNATDSIITQAIEATTISVEKITIPAYDSDNPSVNYGGDESGLVTFDALDIAIDAKIQDAIESKIIIDSRTPEAYEVDTGEPLANGVIYFQVSKTT